MSVCCLKVQILWLLSKVDLMGNHQEGRDIVSEILSEQMSLGVHLNI